MKYICEYDPHVFLVNIKREKIFKKKKKGKGEGACVSSRLLTCVLPKPFLFLQIALRVCEVAVWLL